MPIKLSDFLSDRSGILHFGDYSARLINSDDRSYLASFYASYELRHRVMPRNHFDTEWIDAKLKSFQSFADQGLGILVISKRVIDPKTQEELNPVIGFGGFSWMDDVQTQVELNCVLMPEYQNLKNGTVLTDFALDLAFNQLGHRAVYGEALDWNTPSQACQEKNGMEPVPLELLLNSTIHGRDNFKATHSTLYVLTKEAYEAAKASSKEVSTSSSRSRELKHPYARTMAQMIADDKAFLEAHFPKVNLIGFSKEDRISALRPHKTEEETKAITHAAKRQLMFAEFEKINDLRKQLIDLKNPSQDNIFDQEAQKKKIAQTDISFLRRSTQLGLRPGSESLAEQSFGFFQRKFRDRNSCKASSGLDASSAFKKSS